MYSAETDPASGSYPANFNTGKKQTGKIHEEKEADEFRKAVTLVLKVF